MPDDQNQKVKAFLDTVRGLVRPFVTLTFVGLIVYLATKEKVEPAFITGIAGTIIGYWFGDRKNKLPEG